MAENPSDVVTRWKNAMKASTQKIKDKVMAMTTNPMTEAAKQKDAYVAGVQDAADSGRWEAGLKSVSLDDWKNKTATVGTGRIAAGVEAATTKMTNFLTQALPYTESVSRQVQAMPKATLDDRINRAVANMRMMSQFKYRKS